MICIKKTFSHTDLLDEKNTQLVIGEANQEPSLQHIVGFRSGSPSCGAASAPLQLIPSRGASLLCSTGRLMAPPESSDQSPAPHRNSHSSLSGSTI